KAFEKQVEQKENEIQKKLKAIEKQLKEIEQQRQELEKLKQQMKEERDRELSTLEERMKSFMLSEIEKIKSTIPPPPTSPVKEVIPEIPNTYIVRLLKVENEISSIDKRLERIERFIQQEASKRNLSKSLELSSIRKKKRDNVDERVLALASRVENLESF